MNSAHIAAAAQLACLLEVSAPKPGNVSPGRPFADMGFDDFLASAVAIGPAMAQAGERPLGVTVRDALDATARWTRANTNLGIVLLLAPLARAAHARVPGDLLRDELTRVLASTTVEDARDVYQAIRRASPGGLGEVPDQDVGSEPTASLVEVMRLAADRDDIAREYATGFETTFETGAIELRRLRDDWPLVGRRDRSDVPDALGRASRHPHRQEGGLGCGAARVGGRPCGTRRRRRDHARGARGGPRFRRTASRSGEPLEPRHDRGSHCRGTLRPLDRRHARLEKLDHSES